MSIESLKPELYTQASLDSTGRWNGVAGSDDNNTDANFLLVSAHSSPLGHIHISLVYDEQKKTLIVTIIEAAHLPPPSLPPPSPTPPVSSSANRKDPPQSNP